MTKHLRNYALIFQSLFILPLAQAQDTQWDWVPRESLTAEQQANLSRYCHGSYINSWTASNTANTILSADVIMRDPNGIVHLQGAAEIIQPGSSLLADRIEGVPNEYYQATGDVSLSSASQLIRSTSSRISTDSSNVASFDDARFLSYDTGTRIEARSLSNDKDGVIFIEEGVFTTCEPNDESWKLYGSSIKLDTQSGFGTAKHVQIRIADVPLFYFPWLRFPLDERRQTGFLFPKFSYSNSDGIRFSAPFYWNISPALDATITPNYIQNSGEGFDLELRHLSAYGKTTYEQSLFSENDEGTQSLRKLTSKQTFNDHFSAGTTLEDNPTSGLYPETNSTSIGEKTNYERSLYVGLNNGNFINKLTYLTYQTPDSSDDQPYEWLPRIDSSYGFATTLLDYEFAVQYTDFHQPEQTDFDGERIAFHQDINIHFSNSWGYLSTGILTQMRHYDLQDYQTNSKNETLIAHATTYLDSFLTFERHSDDGQWRQTLEPRFSYLNSPYANQDDVVNFDTSDDILNYDQAFSHTRFSGNDRIGDTEQVTLGVESRLYDVNNNEKWGFKAAKIFYLEDRYVDIDGDTDENTAIDDSEHSDLITSAHYNSSHYRLTSNLNFDLGSGNINLIQVIAQLEPAEEVKIQLSSLYSVNNSDSDNDAKQTSIGAVFPLSQHWSMYSQYTYDFFEDQAIKQITGLGYENCCLKVSFSYQDWLDDDEEFDRGVFLQFTLRGLGGTGSDNDQTSIADTYWNQGTVGY